MREKVVIVVQILFLLKKTYSLHLILSDTVDLITYINAQF